MLQTGLGTETLSRWVVEARSEPWLLSVCLAFAEAHSSDSGASCCLGLHSCRWLCDDVVNTRLFFNNTMLLLCYIIFLIVCYYIVILCIYFIWLQVWKYVIVTCYDCIYRYMVYYYCMLLSYAIIKLITCYCYIFLHLVLCHYWPFRLLLLLAISMYILYILSLL